MVGGNNRLQSHDRGVTKMANRGDPRRVGVGLIGYGGSGSVFHAPLIRAEPRLRLAVVCDIRTEQVRGDLPDVDVLAAAGNLFDRADVELVVVATPNSSHAELARAALLAGKHVVVDKPLTVTTRDADELIALATHENRLLSVFQNRRWDGDFRTVRECINSGALGEVVSYSAHFDRYVPRVDDGWREQPLDGSGALYDLGAHLIDQALVIFGLPLSVWGDVRTQRPGGRTPDAFHVFLDYGRLQVVLHAGSLIRDPGPRFQIHGEHGSFVKYGIDTQEAMLKAGRRPGEPGWGIDPDDGRLTYDLQGLDLSAAVATLPGDYQSYYARIAAAILDSEPLPVVALEARNVVRIIEYVAESQASGRRVVTEWAAAAHPLH